MIHIKRIFYGFLFCIIVALTIVPPIFVQVTGEYAWYLLYTPHAVMLLYFVGVVVLAKVEKPDETRT